MPAPKGAGDSPKVSLPNGDPLGVRSRGMPGLARDARHSETMLREGEDGMDATHPFSTRSRPGPAPSPLSRRGFPLRSAELTSKPAHPGGTPPLPHMSLKDEGVRWKPGKLQAPFALTTFPTLPYTFSAEDDLPSATAAPGNPYGISPQGPAGDHEH
jgi:hypothetical protein